MSPRNPMEWFLIAVIVAGIALYFTACTSPAPIASVVAGPKSDLCTSTRPLSFSVAAINAMDRDDLLQYDNFNITRAQQCPNPKGN